jgi:hypothetical protein
MLDAILDVTEARIPQKRCAPGTEQDWRHAQAMK